MQDVCHGGNNNDFSSFEIMFLAIFYLYVASLQRENKE